MNLQKQINYLLCIFFYFILDLKKNSVIKMRLSAISQGSSIYCLHQKKIFE